MKTIEIQKKFFKHVTSKKRNIYNILIFNRYDDILSEVFYETKKSLKKKRWEIMVRKFIKKGARNNFLWKMPQEFFTYHKKSLRDYKKDIFRYEFVKYKIFTNKKKIQKRKLRKFKKIDFTHNAKILKLDYNIFHTKKEKKKFFILIYKFKNQIYIQTISNFLYHFLNLSKKENIEKTIKQSCKKFNLPAKKTEKILYLQLKKWHKMGIIY